MHFKSIIFSLVIILIVSGISFIKPEQTKAQVIDIGWPFPDCETWYVLQGYYSKAGYSHHGKYAFDLLKGSPTSDAQTGLATIIAPMSGHVYVYSFITEGFTNWGVVIKNGAYEFRLNHLEQVVVSSGQRVNKGDHVGYVFNRRLGGYKHLDITLDINNVRGPFTVPGTVWQFPVNGPAHPTWGTWAGTKLESNCQSADDFNKDGKSDFYLINKKGIETNSTEVHILNGIDNFQSQLLHTSTLLPQTGLTNEWIFLLADYNSDGKSDLYAINKEGVETNSTEVHVLNGADNFQSWLLSTSTIQHKTGLTGEWTFALADYNGDRKPDLYAIDREGVGSNSTEVHVLNGADDFQSWLLHTGTLLHQTGLTNEWAFAVADYNSDGRPDLYAIDREGIGSDSTEVHILNGADNFQSWLLHTSTIQHKTGLTGEWAFLIADYNGDKKPDLYVIDREGTGSNSTEVHILNGADNFQSWLLHTGTIHQKTGINCQWDFGTGGDCITNVAPNTPQPIEPLNDSIMNSHTITLKWQDMGDPDNLPVHYRNYYAEIWNLERSVFVTVPLYEWYTNTSWNITLPADGNYYWSVRSGDGELNSSMSQTWRFSVDTGVLPTATPTHTVAPTATPTHTVAPTATPTHTVAPTATPTHTVVPTATPTHTVAPTATPTHTVTPTATPTHTVVPTATPTHTVAPTTTPSAVVDPTQTPFPTPTSNPQVQPALYFNYRDGAPGSSFLVIGYHFPAGARLQLSINGVAIGPPVDIDPDGRFSRLIATNPAATTGYYVLVANTLNRSTNLAQTGVGGASQQYYQLALDAPQRQAPSDAPESLPVPPTIPAFEQPPVIFLPLIRR